MIRHTEIGDVRRAKHWRLEHVVLSRLSHDVGSTPIKAGKMYYSDRAGIR